MSCAVNGYQLTSSCQGASDEFENEMVLAAVQALVCAVTPPLLAVGLSVDAEVRRVDLWFAMSKRTDSEYACVHDVLTDMRALTAGQVRIEARTWVGPTWTDGWPGLSTRLLYATRP